MAIKTPKEEIYFNFPLILLVNYLVNPKKCLEDIRAYGIYAYSQTSNVPENADPYDMACSFFKQLIDVNTWIDGQTLFDSISQTDKPVMVGINVGVWNEYYNNDKTEFEHVCLLAYLALKSIVQQKTFQRITNKYWFSRMAGLAKQVEVEELPDQLKKLCTRHYIHKIKRELKNKWHLVTYARRTRGFFVSFKLDLNALAVEVEKLKNKTIDRKLKQLESEAYERAKAQLGK